jgi:hypothetical protein
MLPDSAFRSTVGDAARFESPKMLFEPFKEVRKGTGFPWRPEDFRQRTQSRKHHVLDMIGAVHVLGPDITLSPDYKLCQFRRKI